MNSPNNNGRWRRNRMKCGCRIRGESPGARQEAYPDFDEVVDSPVEVSKAMQDAILRAPNGADIAYYPANIPGGRIALLILSQRLPQDGPTIGHGHATETQSGHYRPCSPSVLSALRRKPKATRTR